MRAEEIIATHPDVQGSVARNLIAAIAETSSCARVCTSCADVCVATGMTVTRRAGSNEELIAEMLAVCATACRLCAEECARHATMHEHCRICAEASLACAHAGQRALGDVGCGLSDAVVDEGPLGDNADAPV